MIEIVSARVKIAWVIPWVSNSIWYTAKARYLLVVQESFQLKVARDQAFIFLVYSVVSYSSRERFVESRIGVE